MSKARAARGEIISALRAFMVGPYAGEEQELLAAGTRDKRRTHINQTAADLYHTGILYPANSRLDPEESEQEENGDEEQAGAGDGILSLANAMQQSAMGATFRLSKDVSHIQVGFSWGEYSLIERKSEESNWEDFDKKRSDSAELGWRRNPFSQVIIRDVSEVMSRGGSVLLFEQDKVCLYARARMADDAISLTLALVNERHEVSERCIDKRVYQSEIRVEIPHGGVFQRVAAPPRDDDREAWNYELLFYSERDYAVGHGISALWSLGESGHCEAIKTSWIPECEVFKASSEVDEIDDQSIFEMRLLGDPDRKKETLSGFRLLADAYENWICKAHESIAKRWDSATAREGIFLSSAAEENLEERCRPQLVRLRTAIDELESGDFPYMWESFVLANQAMRSSMLRGRAVKEGDEPRWRPFQLAFFLIALRSSIDPGHHERDILDLIWFPTGGGKTEAYLGLSCAVIFHRRLSMKSRRVFGTTVITRYTLRLLTLQQFERAARVIFACELLRRSRPEDLGAEPVSIGLYAGKDATPNKLRAAQDMISTGSSDGVSTTLPVDVCPWCSEEDSPTSIEFRNQEVDAGRVLTKCPNEKCDFHDGLPFWCVDDELYAFPPTFLIGTVDKFAQLTWEPRSAALLRGASRDCPPPSMIIQDELHLISDSLGSITGLYETAIDLICESFGAVPKIIGSTATIKRAESQARQLFDRKAVQFPPSGIEHTDSFFYREDRDNPGRMYVGVHAQGRSPKHTLPRTMALLKQFALQIQDRDLQDRFHTLVCYFNSLRELGGALVLAEDDAPRYLDSLGNGGLLPSGMQIGRLQPVEELTSNLKVPEIRALLKRLSVGLTSPDPSSEPIGLVLSTNMISVGVDVDRLGSMIVNGQPKTTAEYIQASSRVGRTRGDAGLVVTLYNWTRPRDRSHYERFVGYHRAFYRHVEALTVTPYSPRARDKALHSVFFALARHLCPEISGQDAAGALTDEIVERLKTYIDLICNRAAAVSDEDVDEVREELYETLDDWKEIVRSHQGENVVWSTFGGGRKSSIPLMGVKEGDAGLYKTPLSMRDVDAQCPVMLRWESRS